VVHEINETLLPQYIYLIDDNEAFNGMTLINGTIVINERNFKHYTNNFVENEGFLTSVAKCALILFHEILHKKRIYFCTNPRPWRNTPIKYKGKSVTKKGEAGEYVELLIFGFCLHEFIELITDSIAKEFLNIENWKDVTKLFVIVSNMTDTLMNAGYLTQYQSIPNSPATIGTISKFCGTSYMLL